MLGVRDETYSERARRISRSCPTRATVEPHALVSHYAEDASSPERLWVCLPLYLQDVQREEHDLADADQRPCCSVHHRLPRAFAECPVEVVAIMQRQVIPREGLTTVFVYSLEDLVAGSVAETGEEGGEFAAERGGGFIFEDDFV